jgi:hypothetical protein
MLRPEPAASGGAVPNVPLTNHPNPLHLHLSQTDRISIDSPELARLAEATGYSRHHLFKVAIGRRVPQQRLALALQRVLGDDSFTVAALSNRPRVP